MFTIFTGTSQKILFNYFINLFFFNYLNYLKFLLQIAHCFYRNFSKSNYYVILSLFHIVIMTMDDKITLLSNNVREIKNSHNRIKLFEHLEKNAILTGIV